MSLSMYPQGVRRELTCSHNTALKCKARALQILNAGSAAGVLGYTQVFGLCKWPWVSLLDTDFPSWSKSDIVSYHLDQSMVLICRSSVAWFQTPFLTTVLQHSATAENASVFCECLRNFAVPSKLPLSAECNSLENSLTLLQLQIKHQLPASTAAAFFRTHLSLKQRVVGLWGKWHLSCQDSWNVWENIFSFFR
jgi:hypothetical protein